ncbi:amidoligase family protein [Nitrosophilus kaiyonis]|uniref:amidoligase family protein n=1 Tax=Nitrosophilus kaiyonis TaxID=2930200 RepID=UPI0024910B3D|nr:amidoligase family protein [Nitrosophilus kaiyonis]
MQDFILPPIKINTNNELRKVGFEIEYSGITLKECAAIIIELFGGKIIKDKVYFIKIKDTIFGDFILYIDSKFLREFEEKYKNLFLDKKEIENIEDILLSISETIVPYEIVTPPIKLDSLQKIETLREKLKKRGALGTKSSIFFAFGLHINIETYSFEPSEILDILRSFLILYDWIKEKSNIDLTRKLTWFIDPFEIDYILKVIDLDYRPDIDNLIADYILYNPTRNRALDLLPLFAFINENVKKKLPNEKISPRPAFHYRLPNSRIDEDDWSIAKEFNYWSLIEHLAYQKTKLKKLCTEYKEFLKSPLWFITSSWVDKIDSFIKKEFKEFYCL